MSNLIWGCNGVTGVVDPRKALDLTPLPLRVNSLGVALFTHLQGGVHKDFHKTVLSHQVARIAARRPVRTHRRADDDATVTHDFRRHKPNAPDIDVAIFLAKPQAFREMRPDDDAIQDRDLATML